MYEIVFSTESLEDISQIHNFISQDNSIIADKVTQAIMNTIQYLTLFPELWPEIWNSEYREIMDGVYKYQIRYSIVWDTIRIATIYKFKNI